MIASMYVHGNLAATFAFSLLVCGLQGLHVALPLTDGAPATRFQSNYSISISYLAYAPIIFQATLVACTYSFSQVSILHDSYYFLSV